MKMVDTYVGPDQYVKVIGERADGSKTYAAGPKSKKYDTGDIVPNSYAAQVLGSINFRNRVYGLVENQSEETPDTYQEAQLIISEFNTLGDELNKAQERENEERIEEIEQQINDLRADLGSP